MTPEERAGAVVEAWATLCTTTQIWPPDRTDLVSRVALALREYGAAVLESEASKLDALAQENPADDKVQAVFRFAAERIASDLRARAAAERKGT